MSESLITGKKGSAFQPWQLATFDKSGRKGHGLPTAAEMERLHQQSREEGYRAGYEEGRKQAGEEAQRVRALLDGVQRDLVRLDQTVADELLTLALDIAHRMLGVALQARPELVLTVVQDAIRCLPQYEQPVRVFVHPEDAQLLDAQLGGQAAANGWTLVHDAKIARGGCRVQTAASEIDATTPSRWARVLAAFGRDQDWLAT